MSYIITLLVLLLLPLNALEIDEKTSGFDLLPTASIYIDNTNTLSYEQVVTKTFTPNTQKVLGFGIAPSTALWIRFTLKNRTDQAITKVLEYPDAQIEILDFHYDGQLHQDGMFQINREKESIYPSLTIVLEPYEEKVFYVKAYSKISSLIARIVVWEKDDFTRHDYKHKGFILLFFTVLFTLLIYNFLLLVFTKEKAYLFYILYLVALIHFHFLNFGIAQLYLYPQALTIMMIKANMLHVALLGIAIILFTREFLKTCKFKRFDVVLKGYLYLLPLLALLCYDNIVFDLNIIILLIPVALMTVVLGFYALYKGEQQAKFYVIGWTFVILSLLFSIFKAIGLIDITADLPYLIESAFIFEALLFSIALAHRIRIISEEKSKADQKLIRLQQEEQQRLEKLVTEKTHDLQLSLEEKSILYQELNHRVKNNLQMILSLIKLQLMQATSPEIKSVLITTRNRVSAIAELYERLYLENSGAKVATLSYFQSIIDTISDYFDKDVTVEYAIEHDLHTNELIYCGLIVNELVTNCFKYAFEKQGNITIGLMRDENTLRLTVEDDGVGLTPQQSDSLGLEIVRTLVEKQLYGTLDIASTHGTTVTIQWEEHA